MSPSGNYDPRQQHELLLKIFDHAPVMINFIDADGHIRLVNREWEQTLGWSREEIAEQGLDIFAECYPDPDYRAQVLSWARDATGQLVDCRTRLRDGRVIDTAWAVVKLDDGATIGMGVDVTARREAQEALRHFSRRLVEVQETERRHLANELHDEIGQVLTGLTLVLESAGRLSSVDAVTAKLAQAQTIASELLERVRALSLDLRPAPLDDLGLVAALLWHVDRYTGATGVTVLFTHQGVEGRRFDTEVEMTAYRIVQEALTNVARHARTSQATIHIAADAELLVIEIDDHGCGFDSESSFTASPNGLLGMRERARLLNGRVTIDSAAGRGTRVIAELPIGTATPRSASNVGLS